MQYGIQTLINALSLSGLYAMIALGIALVFSVMRLINFAHGGMITIGGFIVYLLADAGLLIWAPAAILGVAALSFLIERAAFRPLRNTDMTTLLVASFAVNMVIQSVMEMTAGSIPRTPKLPSFFAESVTIGDLSVSKLALTTVAVTVVVLLTLTAFFRATPVGVQMRAAAENFQMARMLGVRSNRVISLAFAMSGALAGLTGILLTAQSGSVNPSTGFQPAIVGFVAVVIGGMGSLSGAAFGGLFLGVVTTFLQAYLPPEATGFRDGMVYLAVILLLLVRPRGLMGTVVRTA